MQISFQSQLEFDLFLCEKKEISPMILLPENILFSDLVKFFQASLDQIKPAILLASDQYRSEINLTELKAHHQKIIPGKLIFLNYSIRNLLSKFAENESRMKSFQEIEDFFVENFQK